MPTNPAPTTARWAPGRSSRCRAAASSSVRRVWTPGPLQPGKTRGVAPVASTSASQGSFSSASVTAVRLATSTAVTRRPSRSSMPFSSQNVRGRNSREAASRITGEVLLGERRPLVGRHRLGAGEPDLAVEAERPQGLGAAGPRETGADDEHAGRCLHAASSTASTVIAPIGTGAGCLHDFRVVGLADQNRCDAVRSDLECLWSELRAGAEAAAERAVDVNAIGAHLDVPPLDVSVAGIGEGRGLTRPGAGRAGTTVITRQAVPATTAPTAAV